MQTKRRRDDDAGPRPKRAKLVDGSDIHVDADDSDDDTSVHDFRRVQIVHKRKQNLDIPVTFATLRVERPPKEVVALLSKGGIDSEALFHILDSFRVQDGNDLQAKVEADPSQLKERFLKSSSSQVSQNLANTIESLQGGTPTTTEMSEEAFSSRVMRDEELSTFGDSATPNSFPRRSAVRKGDWKYHESRLEALWAGSETGSSKPYDPSFRD
jgi:hypothetical protein